LFEQRIDLRQDLAQIKDVTGEFGEWKREWRGEDEKKVVCVSIREYATRTRSDRGEERGKEKEKKGLPRMRGKMTSGESNQVGS